MLTVTQSRFNSQPPLSTTTTCLGLVLFVALVVSSFSCLCKPLYLGQVQSCSLVLLEMRMKLFSFLFAQCLRLAPFFTGFQILDILLVSIIPAIGRATFCRQYSFAVPALERNDRAANQLPEFLWRINFLFHDYIIQCLNTFVKRRFQSPITSGQSSYSAVKYHSDITSQSPQIAPHCPWLSCLIQWSKHDCA